MTPQELAERGIRVKPLEWLRDLRWPADQFAEGYTVTNLEPEVWDVQFPGGSLATYPYEEAAKAAAEADHAARIAAQLECSRAECEGPGVTG